MKWIVMIGVLLAIVACSSTTVIVNELDPKALADSHIEENRGEYTELVVDYISSGIDISLSKDITEEITVSWVYDSIETNGEESLFFVNYTIHAQFEDDNVNVTFTVPFIAMVDIEADSIIAATDRDEAQIDFEIKKLNFKKLLGG